MDYFDSPLGWICVKASPTGITNMAFVPEADGYRNPNQLTDSAVSQLSKYFLGRVSGFELDLDLEGHSDFCLNVWDYLLKIPYGQTRTYRDIAVALGDTNAVRAVGRANGKNPIPIIIPCHRVIGSSGDLTGYAFGVERKRALLALENPNQFAMNGKLF